MRVLLSTVLLLLQSSTLYAKEACINNFNKQICREFEILNSVIVKSSLTKMELKNKLNKPITQIAFLGEFGLFLIDANNSLAYAQKLTEDEFIIYAQPNISQKKEVNSNKEAIRLVQADKQQHSLRNIWKTTKGKGIKIAIIDDGFNLAHEDLKNVDVTFSYDVNIKELNSKPKVKIDKHGTQVAGIIFSQHNGIGNDGIAPEASLIAIRQTTNITSDVILAFTVADKSRADIINCSWNSPLLLEPVYDIITYLIEKGRNNKGMAIVFSAGNDGKKLKPYSTEASIPEVITVGSFQKHSNNGEMVDFIMQSNVNTTKYNGSYGKFGGTSATAPIISGYIALEMSRSPDLSLNEIIKNVGSIIK